MQTPSEIDGQPSQVAPSVPLRHAPRWRHLPDYLLLALTLAGTLPLLLSPYPPGMDWPQHVAIVDVLVRLYRGDAGIAQHYVFAPQAVGYHLFYLLTVPLALLLGAASAVQVVMVGVLWAHVGACAWWLRRNGRPVLFACAGMMSFYGAHFSYGFVVTMVPTPLVFLLLATLAAGPTHTARTPVRRLGLAACAMLVAFGHVVFAPFVALGVLAALLWRGRAAVSDACAVATGLGVAVLPGLVLRGLATRAGTGANTITFDKFIDGFNHLHKWSYAIDRGWAQAGLAVFGASCLVASCFAGPPERRAEQRVLLTLLTAALGSVWFVPYYTSGPIGESLLLNIRWLCLVPWLFALLAASGGIAEHPQARRWSELSLLNATVLLLVGVTRLSLAYAADTRGYREASKKIAVGARMGAYDEVIAVGTSWPTVRFNLSFMAFPGRLAAHSGLFVGGHLPVRERVAGEPQRAQKAAREFAGALLHEPRPETPAVEEMWATCEVVALQGPKMQDLPAIDPNVARTLGQGRGWRLFAAPK